MNQQEVDAINLRASRRARTTYADGVQDFAARADKAFSECGLERPRRPRAGENGMRYRADVMEEFLSATAKPENSEWFPCHWSTFDPGNVFIEGKITAQGADALAENIFNAVSGHTRADGGRPAYGFRAPVGPVRSCVSRDNTGRETLAFYGDEQAAWLPFTSYMTDTGEVRGWKTGRLNCEMGRGTDSYEARATRARQNARLQAAYAALDAAEASAGAAGV